MTSKPHAPARKTEPAKPKVATEKACTVVRDLTVPGCRIVIKCDGEPDVVLLDFGGHPEKPVIHASGTSNASLT